MTTTTYDAVDALSFAGGFTCGTVQAGFHLVGKREYAGGFGVASCEANRKILGDDWETQCAPGEAWEPVQVPYVFGNPPCSGFSLLSAKSFRGIDSPVNSCMWDFVRYASACNAEIMVFESVAQAWKIGRPLMQSLREEVERITGDRWTLTHVLHNAYSVGGCAIRRRYFFVCHRIPFGVEKVDLKRVPTLRDAIEDLEPLHMGWASQPYRQPASWWAKRLRSRRGVVDGHVNIDTPATRRALELIGRGTGVKWGEREHLAKVAGRYWEKHGDLPESWRHLGSYQKMVGQAPDFMLGYNTMIRWRYDGCARVITGGALDLVLHPTLPRTITHREALRVQGFPDDWRIGDLEGVSGLRMFWGKGIPVQCGRWVSDWVRESLDGNPGEDAGEEIGDREFLVDHTHHYKELGLSKEV